MSELFQIVQSIIERGLIFSFVVMGVYLASELINFDNLSVEGAFGLGGALTIFLLNNGINSWATLGIVLCSGALSGIITGYLHTQLKLNQLISGIVVTTGLFSVILKIAGSNQMLSTQKTIFETIPTLSWLDKKLLFLLLAASGMIVIVQWFLQTQIGFLLHAVGENPQMLINIGKSVNLYKISGIALSNALAALSGFLFVQYTGYFSIWASVGVLIIGLAGMILAQSLTKHFGFALLVGSIFYQALITLTFELQLDQSWNKLITALLIVLLITIKQTVTNQGEETC